MEEMLKSVTVLIECSRESDDADFHEQGTGVLIHTNHEEYDYVITAHHCLAGNRSNRHGYILDDITIKSQIYSEINVIYSYDDDECDISIIKIEKLKYAQQINIYIKEKRDHVLIYAYPNLELNRFEIDGICKFKGKIEDYKNDFNILTVKIEAEDMNIQKNAQKKMAGCSGAGVFLRYGKTIQLVGILTEVDNDDNPFNTLIATSVKRVEKFIKSINLIPIDFILDKKLVDFQQDCFCDVNKDKLQDVLMDYLNEIGNLKIKRIIDLLGEKIIFPCIGEAYNDNNLWISWAEFITLMIIYSNSECGSNEDGIIEYFKKFRDENTKFYYSYVSDLGDIVRNIYSDEFNDIIYAKCKENNTILVDFKQTGCIMEHIEGDQVARIVSNISSANHMSKKNRIDNPKVNKNLRFMHMNLLKNKMFTDCYYFEDRFEIKEKVKQGIKEVFDNVRGR